MKNRLHIYDINTPKLRYVHEYTKYKIFLSIMVVICIRENLSNTWSSVQEKVKQHWRWVEKKRCL